MQDIMEYIQLHYLMKTLLFNDNFSTNIDQVYKLDQRSQSQSSPPEHNPDPNLVRNYL